VILCRTNTGSRCGKPIRIRTDIAVREADLGIIMAQLERLAMRETLVRIALVAALAGAVLATLLTLAFSH
jgi:hypothetical protein